jgi:hypothetical protein
LHAATEPGRRLRSENGSRSPVNEFLQTALTFPTVAYSILLAVCAVYWLLAATGLADGDALDAMGGEGDAGEAGAAAAMLSRLGLPGVPLMVVLTTLSFVAWVGTYFVHLLVLRNLPDGVRTSAGVGTLVGMLIPALAVTSLALRPVSRMMVKLRPATDASLLGKAGVIVTPTLTADAGQAAVDDGGAGLILQVRHGDPGALARGDRVVLIEYLEGENAYLVVSEPKFLGR